MNGRSRPGDRKLFACSTSRAWNSQRPRFTRLRREANRGVDGTKPLIIAALHDLEEKPFVEGVGGDLEDLAPAFAVVQNLVVAKGCHRCRVEIVFGLDIVVVVVRNLEEIRATRAHVS